MDTVKFRKIYEDAIVPTKGSPGAAGRDLYAYLEVPEITIPPHRTQMISTGIAVEIPEGYFGGIYARSGLAAKKGLRPGNCTGVVDCDYIGEIMVALHNDTDEPQTIKTRDRIAQLVIQPYLDSEYEEVDKLTETERGAGGFGSTGR